MDTRTRKRGCDSEAEEDSVDTAAILRKVVVPPSTRYVRSCLIFGKRVAASKGS